MRGGTTQFKCQQSLLALIAFFKKFFNKNCCFSSGRLNLLWDPQFFTVSSSIATYAY